MSPTRRDVVATATTAALGATDLLAYVRPAKAETPGPIEAAYPELVRLLDAWDAACSIEWEAEERYEQPPRPLWHPATSEGGYEMVRLPSVGHRACLSLAPDNLEQLRSLAEAPYVPSGDVSARLGRHLHHRRTRTARATLDKIEAWQAEDRRRQDEAGLTEARAAQERARDAAHAQLESMYAAPASSFRELAFQAAYLREDSNEERVSAVVRRLVELAGIAPREV